MEKKGTFRSNAFLRKSLSSDDMHKLASKLDRKHHSPVGPITSNASYAKPTSHQTPLTPKDKQNTWIHNAKSASLHSYPLFYLQQLQLKRRVPMVSVENLDMELEMATRFNAFGLRPSHPEEPRWSSTPASLNQSHPLICPHKRVEFMENINVRRFSKNDKLDQMNSSNQE